MDDTLVIRASYHRKRAARALHRTRLRLRAVSQAPGPPSRPVFVIGSARSGTTLLYALLRRHADLAGSQTEGHLLWDAYQHPARKGWGSDRSTASDIAEGEPRFLYASIRSVAGDSRFIDKTPRNSLRVPYLDALFPDASFVFLHRDGRANVASLMDGWTARHGVSYRLPERIELDAYQGRYWSYLLPPTWRSVINGRLEDVAACQYVGANDTALRDLGRIAPDRVVRVGFEELLEEPVATARRLLDELDLVSSPAVERFASSLGEHEVSVITPPRPEKWRARADEIERVLPTMAPTMRRLGYLTAGQEERR